jgi:hypothetical protein
MGPLGVSSWRSWRLWSDSRLIVANVPPAKRSRNGRRTELPVVEGTRNLLPTSSAKTEQADRRSNRQQEHASRLGHSRSVGQGASRVAAIEKANIREPEALGIGCEPNCGGEIVARGEQFGSSTAHAELDIRAAEEGIALNEIRISIGPKRSGALRR